MLKSKSSYKSFPNYVELLKFYLNGPHEIIILDGLNSMNLIFMKLLKWYHYRLWDMSYRLTPDKSAELSYIMYMLLL